MNSIFTNALPGQNEDSHIYTLKERFTQENGGNTDDNNYNNNEQQLNDMNQRDQRDNISPKYKNYSEQNMMMNYNMRSRSPHRSRSRSRLRERSRERDRYRDRRDNQRSRSKKYSRSNSRNFRRSNSRQDDYNRKRRENDRDKNMGRNYQRSYSLFSYTENGVTKINTYFTVPDHLVSLLIGKKGENVRSIMNSTGAVITFCKEVSKYYIFLFNINY